MWWMAQQEKNGNQTALNLSKVSLLKALPHEEGSIEWDVIAYISGITVVLQTCKNKDEALKVLRGYISGGIT